MQINGRQKGAQAEREVIKKLQAVVDYVLGKDMCVLKRNLEQYRGGGADVTCSVERYDLFSFEIKRCEKLMLEKFWKQTLKQAKQSKRRPVLIFRRNRESWSAMIFINLGTQKNIKAIISLNDFLKYYAEMLNRKSKKCKLHT